MASPKLGGTYAADTQVSPEKSRAEIEATLKRYGATAFGFGQDGARTAITFRLKEGVVCRLDVYLPSLEDFAHDARGSWIPQNQRQQRRDKWERQRWRAIALYVKAKCEAVEVGIESAQHAWLPYILLPSGQTTGEFVVPQVTEAYETGAMPSLLPGVRGELGEG